MLRFKQHGYTTIHDAELPPFEREMQELGAVEARDYYTDNRNRDRLFRYYFDKNRGELGYYTFPMQCAHIHDNPRAWGDDQYNNTKPVERF